jgi:exopolysaccharide production protein ExoQ
VSADNQYARRDRGIPWLTFLFLAATFFLIYHDTSNSKKGIDNYGASKDDLIAAVDNGSLTRRVALSSLGFFAIATLFRYRIIQRLRIHGALGWLILGFVAWAMLSLIWAEDVALTSKRLIVFGILCAAAVALASRFSIRQMILWTLFSTTLYLIVGVSAEVFFGTFRPFASGYRFAGTLPVNGQGINCALLLLSGLAAADLEKHRRTLFRACALVGFTFLILTESRTAIAAALFAYGVYWGAVYSNRAKIVMACVVSITLCLLFLFLGDAFSPRLGGAVMLGRDDATPNSFNGRVGVWKDVGYYIDRHPVLGYGYAGFWTPAHISEISREEKWGIPDSHSAYLDYLLTLGVPGLVVYVLLLSIGIRRAFRLHELSQNSALAFFGALLLFCALDGLLESAVFDPTLLMFLGMVALAQLAFVITVSPSVPSLVV